MTEPATEADWRQHRDAVLTSLWGIGVHAFRLSDAELHTVADRVLYVLQLLADEERARCEELKGDEQLIEHYGKNVGEFVRDLKLGAPIGHRILERARRAL
jgi:hypothetical protein